MRRLRQILSLCAVLLLAGCGSYQYKMADVAQSVATGADVSTAAANLQAIKSGKLDVVHKAINLAMLYHMAGKFNQSRQQLVIAKDELERLDGISIGESVAAVSVNDTLRSYVPKNAERLLIYELQILNYLALGDLDGARVEVLQAGEQLNLYQEDSGKKSARLVSLYFLSGLVYELNHEYSDAMISYRDAYNLLGNAAVPPALSNALVVMAARLGLSEELAQYRQRFEVTDAKLAKLQDQNSATLVGLYYQGMVARLNSNSVSLFVPELNHAITLALPQAGSPTWGTPPAPLLVGEQALKWAELDNFQTRAQQDLDRAQAANTARMVARAVAKHQVSQQLAQNSNQNAVMLFDIVNLFLEVADTRNWNTAPARILATRSVVPAGVWQIISNKPPLAVVAGARHVVVYVANQYAKNAWLFANR